jgi:hypothetical protein
MVKALYSTRLNPLPCLLVMAFLAAASVAVRAEVSVRELSYLDRQYMQQVRSELNDLASRNFGSRFNGDKDHDLALLQSLLDRRLVVAGQTRELQGMGVLLGDLLAVDLGMNWVVYEDHVGRSRALRYRQSDNYLFPVTMISRRREAENDTPVRTIYQKAYDLIAPLRDPLPFQ